MLALRLRGGLALPSLEEGNGPCVGQVSFVSCKEEDGEEVASMHGAGVCLSQGLLELLTPFLLQTLVESIV